MMSSFSTNDSYRRFLSDIKQRIQQAQIRAMVTVNQQLLLLYWEIGCQIRKRQEESQCSAPDAVSRTIDYLRGSHFMKALQILAKNSPAGRRAIIAVNVELVRKEISNQNYYYFFSEIS